LPILAKHVPWSIEKKIASVLNLTENLSLCDANGSSTELKKLIARIYPIPGDANLPIHVNVIAGKTINAFASFGGEVFVYDGLIQKAESPEELAGVLAHEIGHVHHRHIIEGMLSKLTVLALSQGSGTSGFNLLANLKFSREQEAEADRDGLERLQKAHVNVLGTSQFFKREGNTGAIPSLLSDHPSSEDRAQLAQSYFRMDTTPILTPAEWTKLKGICGK
jgi:predicted Zn-dependent protease